MLNLKVELADLLILCFYFMKYMCNWMLRASDRVTKLPNWIGSEFQFKNRYVPWRCQQSDVIFRPCYAALFKQTKFVRSAPLGGTKGTKGFHSWHCRWEPNDRTRCGTPRDGSASGRNGSLCRSACDRDDRAPPAKHRNI